MPKPGTPEYREHIKQAVQWSQTPPSQRIQHGDFSPETLAAFREQVAASVSQEVDPFDAGGLRIHRSVDGQG